MFDTFNEIWKEFLEHGRITEEEYLRMTLPQYYNTVEEFSHPLVEVDHPVYHSGLNDTPGDQPQPEGERILPRCCNTEAKSSLNTLLR